MGIAYKINVDSVNIEDIAIVVGWLFSDARKRVAKSRNENYEPVDIIYLVDCQRANPSFLIKKEIDDLLAQEQFSVDNQTHLDTLVTKAVQTAMLIYCGYWDYDKIRYISGEEVADVSTDENNVREVFIEKEILKMKDIKDDISRQKDKIEQLKEHINETLIRAISPEFSRLSLQIQQKHNELLGNHSELDKKHEETHDMLIELLKRTNPKR